MGIGLVILGLAAFAWALAQDSGCVVYVACRMTGRDKLEMTKRALYVCSILRQFNITAISPVLEEHVEAVKGPLVNDSKTRLAGFWRRDKWIIRREAHLILVDGAQDKSFGVEREYALNRFCLWKPTVLIMPDLGLTVAEFEDDSIVQDPRTAGEFIRANYGTRGKRWAWRIKLLRAKLPTWLLDQMYAWR